jgi:DNA invertase Pin-like site-specific DNA recombinase
VCKFVAYYRVSTERQESSGLGLEAQEAAVAAFLNGRVDDKLLGSYRETESGKRADNRPELLKAMEHAKLTGATLLIAKLDRLSRDAHFLLGLQKAGVKFVAADMPEANTLTVGIMALVAQQEREAISKRTTDALAAAKARGVKLGNPNGAAALRRAGYGRGAGAEAVKANAGERAERLRSTIDALRAEGITSARGIATALNERGVVTARGGKWSADTVMDVMRRLAGGHEARAGL